MKLIKISQDHYVIVDDSEITIGDIVAEKLLTDKYELFTIHTLNDIDKQTQKKITHSTRAMYKDEYISLQEVKELIGEVDVEKNMWYERNVKNPYPSDSPSHTGFKKGFELGYNQALEDNKKKKWTDEDVRRAYDNGYSVRDARGDRSDNMTSDEYVKSTQLKTEWEIEIIDGKLQLK